MKRTNTKEAKVTINRILASQKPFPTVSGRTRGGHLLEPTMSNAFSVDNPVHPIKDREWACIVTTAPRNRPTIKESISSIVTAGWSPIVFAEPESTKVDKVKWFDNSVKLGAWFNWIQSVKWALKNTPAQYIMTVQDDSLFHPDSRSFIESVMWPTNNMGFISLYTASHYSADLSGNLHPYGVNKLKTNSFWGACALVFPRHVLQEILAHPVTENWLGVPPRDMDTVARANFNKRREEAPHTISNVDSAIGRVLKSLGLDMYVIDPSPVRHIAAHSALNHGSNTGKRNCSRCADHSIPLRQQVFPNHRAVNIESTTSTKIREVLEEEIGYTIVCSTCLEFLRTLNSSKYENIPDLALGILIHAPFPDWWRRKYLGRTKRLERIEEIIKPLLST